MVLPTKRYHQLMMKLFDITENGQRFVTIQEAIKEMPYFIKLNSEKAYRGTKQLSFALRWLERNNLVVVDRNRGLNRYKPRINRFEYLERIMRELDIDYTQRSLLECKTCGFIFTDDRSNAGSCPRCGCKNPREVHRFIEAC